MVAMPDLQEQATDLLQRLIRFNTVNPPGDERELQEHLAGYLEDAGLECEMLAADERRPNLIARLRGDADGPTLGLLGHVDTVLADPDAWSRDPWSGDLADGCVWGRGALDMKGQVAAEAAAVAALARQGWRPARGELMLMSVVDEEAGRALGVHRSPVGWWAHRAASLKSMAICPPALAVSMSNTRSWKFGFVTRIVWRPGASVRRLTGGLTPRSTPST